MHEYSVSLVIAGDDLNEAEVTTILGLKPTVFLKKGERLSRERKREESVWSHNVFPAQDSPDWQSLDEGLRCLLETLGPLRGALETLRQRYFAVANCGHFYSAFGGGPSISPETLRQLAELGLTLTLKSYCHDGEPDS